MNIRKLTILIITIFVLLITIGCGQSAILEEIPKIGVSADTLNSKLKLSAPEPINSFTIGEPVVIAVEVISNDQILFPSDYGARIFIYESDEWVEIDNYMIYPEGSILVNPTGNDPFKMGLTDVNPLIPNTTSETTVRIFLVGSIYKNGEITSEKTAGYIDVILKP